MSAPLDSDFTDLKPGIIAIDECNNELWYYGSDLAWHQVGVGSTTPAGACGNAAYNWTFSDSTTNPAALIFDAGDDGGQWVLGANDINSIIKDPESLGDTSNCFHVVVAVIANTCDVQLLVNGFLFGPVITPGGGTINQTLVLVDGDSFQIQCLAGGVSSTASGSMTVEGCFSCP